MFSVLFNLTPWVTHNSPTGTLCSLKIRGLTWGTHWNRDWGEWLPGQNNNSPEKGSSKCPRNATPSVPAWLSPNETNPCQWSRLHKGKRKHIATVVTIISWCHLAQLLHDKLCSSQLQTSSKQHVLLPNREQKARVYFKRAIKINTIVWNTLSCPQAKYYLFVFWLAKVNSI